METFPLAAMSVLYGRTINGMTFYGYRQPGGGRYFNRQPQQQPQQQPYQQPQPRILPPRILDWAALDDDLDDDLAYDLDDELNAAPDTIPVCMLVQPTD